MPASRRFCPATGCSMLWKGSLRDRTASLGGQRRSILCEQSDVQHSRSVRLPRSSTLCLTSHFAEKIQLLQHASIGVAADGDVLVRRESARRPARPRSATLSVGKECISTCYSRQAQD